MYLALQKLMDLWCIWLYLFTVYAVYKLKVYAAMYKVIHVISLFLTWVKVNEERENIYKLLVWTHIILGEHIVGTGRAYYK